MWNNNNQRSLLVPEEEVVVGNNVDSFDNPNNLFGLQHHHTSSAQVSLNFNNNQRSSSLGRSQSLGSVKHQSSINQSSMVNEAFGHPYFSQAGRRFNAPAAQQSNSNRPFERLVPSSRNNNSNPFLGNPKVSSILAAATASSSFATANSTAFSSTSTSSPLFLHSLQKPQQLQPCNISGASISSSSSTDDKSPPISPTPPPNINYASDSTTTQNNNNKNITCTGPTELYRLIASPPHEVSSPNWNVILQRAKSHPHEACFYDSNAGGHVYALHRLLRHTGEECCDDNNNNMDEEEDGCEGCRPPVEVVEAVMKACPRAITRKQAMLDEDEEDLIMSDGNTEGENGNGGSNMQAEHGQPLQNNLNIPLPNNGENAMQNGGNQEPQGEHEDNQDNVDHDDVRFEYPLAIACECEQDGEVVRLLASYLAKSKPVYRSEVFRSLDYASLPTHLVRILLEEYAGCVLERGMNSEVTEGDDDDCPLEQIMFWWDDPDMLNMEEEIMSYPNCNMKDDLCDLYAKLSMMLYAATNGTMAGYDESKGSFQVLHHLLHIVSEGGIKGVHFPNDFAHAVLLLSKFIQKERVTMFEERDDSGSLPLHIAVSGKKLLKPKSDPQLTAENAETNDIVEGNENVIQEAGGQPEEEGMNVAEPEVGEAQQQQNDNGPQHPQAAEQQEEVEPPEQEDEDEEDDDEEEEDNAAEEEIDRSAMDIEIVKLLLDHHPASIRLRDAQSGSLPLHLALQHNPHATDAIEHFLYLHPRSVTMPDGNGRLPLHLALIRESPTWESVLNLSPTTLETRDPVTGLLPFQLAAMSKSDHSTLENDAQEGGQESDDGGELESLSTCFSLLRMSPCLANGLAIVKPRPQSLIEQQIMGRYKPRVTKLEEENESLRKKVEDLERELQSLKMERGSKGVHCTQSGSPHLKKRKSSSP